MVIYEYVRTGSGVQISIYSTVDSTVRYCNTVRNNIIIIAEMTHDITKPVNIKTSMIKINDKTQLASAHLCPVLPVLYK